MTRLDIITLPDPLLRQISQPIERVDDELRQLMDDMLETMYVAPGIGLAAVQVAVPRRLIVVDVGKDSEDTDAGQEGAGDTPAQAGDPGLREADLDEGDDDDDSDEPQRAANPICMINPKILTLGNETASYEEGCLSLPDTLIEIERPTSLTVNYIDRAGEQQLLEAEGLLATVIQHEVDHLDGRLIIDFLSRLKRDMVIRKFKKISRA